MIWFIVSCSTSLERLDVANYVERVHKLKPRGFGSGLRGQKHIDYCCRSKEKKGIVRKDVRKTFPKTKFL